MKSPWSSNAQLRDAGTVWPSRAAPVSPTRPGLGETTCTGPAGSSEPLDPGPELDLPRPGTAVLLEQMKVRTGDRVWIEHGVGCIGRLFPTGVPDRAINHDMGHVNALRGK